MFHSAEFSFLETDDYTTDDDRRDTTRDTDYDTTPQRQTRRTILRLETKKGEKMSRSAADATRFTATGPYANARPAYKLPDFMKSQPTPPRGNDPGHGHGPGRGTTGPSGETPKQKVERLRAQARSRQTGSSLDRVIEVGREVANKAHKVMVYSLITASGTALAPSFNSRLPPAKTKKNLADRKRRMWSINSLLNHLTHAV